MKELDSDIFRDGCLLYLESMVKLKGEIGPIETCTNIFECFDIYF